MIIIDYKDTRPIFEQIVEKFKVMIWKGILKPGAQMPSVRSLAMELSLNPNTIQKVYGILEQQGFIYTVKGKGNYVADTEGLVEVRKLELKTEFRRIWNEAKDVGMTLEDLYEYLREDGK